MNTYSLKLLLSADGSAWASALDRSNRHVKTFGKSVRREFEQIRNAARSVEGRLASLGMSLGVLMLIRQSAELDKSLTQIGQTSGESSVKVTGLRQEIFRMAKETGQQVEKLKEGFDIAVAGGLSLKEAVPVMDAVNKAMALKSDVTSGQLTKAVGVAQTVYNYDLTKPGVALQILDKMTVAGRLGRAELQNLSDEFARVGYNAKEAGLTFEQTLAFLEGLSYAEPQSERRATLADSTLRLFTNFDYLKNAQTRTGIRFFDPKTGGRRDPLKVLGEIREKYLSLKKDSQKAAFMGIAFKGVDIDTVKGLRAFFDKGPMLSRVSNEFVRSIEEAGGTIERDLPNAVDNAVDQAGRLKATLREAADNFVRPFNEGISKGTKKLLDAKEKGGLGLSGNQLLGAGAAMLGGGYLAYRFGGKMAKNILGRLGGSAAGVLGGLTVQKISGVTPVWVTNWPAGFGGGFEGKKIGLPPAKTDGGIGLPPGRGPLALPPASSGPIALPRGAETILKAAPAFAAAATGAVTGTVAALVAGVEMRRQQLGSDRMMEILRTSERNRGGREAGQDVQNQINMTVVVPSTGPVRVETQDRNTRINVKRGDF
jgi:TP901 family phage tail tape measure protein